MPLYGDPKYLKITGNSPESEKEGSDHFGNFGQLSEFINIIYPGQLRYGTAMNLITKAIILTLVATFAHAQTFAKDWQGIVPLRSTRTDVERILGQPKQYSVRGSLYSLRREIVVIRYQHAPCNEEESRFGYGWNVPVGTVTEIGVIPRSSIAKDKFVNDRFVTRDTGGGVVYYNDIDIGLQVETFVNRVSLLNYAPEKTQEDLRCRALERGTVETSPTFDSYASIAAADEKMRLNNYAIQITSLMGRGVFAVYGENPAARRSFRERAERAKDYLVKERGLEAERLLIVDAGYSSLARIDLQIYDIAGDVTRMFFPSEKQKLDQLNEAQY